jgi:hypothetical protein
VSREAPRLGLSAFGLSLLSDVPPPGAWETHPARTPSLELRQADALTIEDSWSGFQAIGWRGLIDGSPFVVERGVEGDHRFVHGEHPDQGVPAPGTRALHHLRADASLLQCAPRDPDDPAWWRLVLDSVLFTVALLQGYEALHAGAIATPDGAIAIAASTGGGKSTLLAELLQRGVQLMADDVLVLERRGAEAPLAHPAPPVMTVPAERLSTLSTRPPQAICAVEDERWIAIPVHPEPLPLKALIVLDRRPSPRESGSGASLSRIESPLGPLLDSLMRFPDVPERQLARFELASVLAARVGLWRLTADSATSPNVLADTLLAGEL